MQFSLPSAKVFPVSYKKTEVSSYWCDQIMMKACVQLSLIVNP